MESKCIIDFRLILVILVIILLPILVIFLYNDFLDNYIKEVCIYEYEYVDFSDNQGISNNCYVVRFSGGAMRCVANDGSILMVKSYRTYIKEKKSMTFRKYLDEGGVYKYSICY